MIILQKLINAMLQRIEAVPVPQQELDDFLAQNQIRLSPEHYRFLLDYGNSSFLTHGFADLSFDEFKDYYSDKELLPDETLPEHYDYVGCDFSNETLCIDPIKTVFTTAVCRNCCFTIYLEPLPILNIVSRTFCHYFAFILSSCNDKMAAKRYANQH